MHVFQRRNSFRFPFTVLNTLEIHLEKVFCDNRVSPQQTIQRRFRQYTIQT